MLGGPQVTTNAATNDSEHALAAALSASLQEQSRVVHILHDILDDPRFHLPVRLHTNEAIACEWVDIECSWCSSSLYAYRAVLGYHPAIKLPFAYWQNDLLGSEMIPNSGSFVFICTT